MKPLIRQINIFAFVLVFGIAVTGCGNGGPASSRTTKAKTSVKTAGLASPGLLVGALEVIISMPYGVTVECIPGTNEPTANVVQLISAVDSNMTMKALVYTPATPANRGSLSIQYYKADGFTPANSILIQLDIATGFFPTKPDFILEKFDIATFNPVNGDVSGSINVNDPSLFGVEII